MLSAEVKNLTDDTLRLIESYRQRNFKEKLIASFLSIERSRIFESFFRERMCKLPVDFFLITIGLYLFEDFIPFLLSRRKLRNREVYAFIDVHISLYCFRYHVTTYIYKFTVRRMMKSTSYSNSTFQYSSLLPL